MIAIVTDSTVGYSTEEVATRGIVTVVPVNYQIGRTLYEEYASDRNGKKPMTVQEVAAIYHTTPTTVQNVRTSYAEKGLEATLQRKKRETPPVPAKVTGDVEARIIALACSAPPKGYESWTLRLLADRIVELDILESVSHTTVDRVLKKTNFHLT